jgi:hypothetical protein
LAKRLQRRRFKKIGPSETRIAYGGHVCWWIGTKWAIFRGPSIDASYQVSLHLAEGFQRRRLKCEKLTDDGQQMPSDGKSSHCLWQGELKRASRNGRGWMVMHFFDRWSFNVEVIICQSLLNVMNIM